MFIFNITLAWHVGKQTNMTTAESYLYTIQIALPHLVYSAIHSYNNL